MSAVHLFFVSMAIAAGGAAPFADRTIALRTTRYDLEYRPDYEELNVSAVCRMEVESTTDGVGTVPLLLYKLMTVDSVHDQNGRELEFAQRDVWFDDVDSMQVNFVEVTLPRPLADRERITLDVRYRGRMQGYVEAGMLYTKDHIDPQFTILRPDCYAYPEVGYPNWNVNRKSGLQEFAYTMTVTVPEGYVVASPGRLSASGSKQGRSTFTFQNARPSWRMDAAIAKYAVLEEEGKKVYYLPGDGDGAAQVLGALEKCTVLYTKWFGPLRGSGPFTVVEVPEGYGSQADVAGMILTADAFKDRKQLHQLYHEISHQWNVDDLDPMPSRWNEGLASFVEWRAADELDQADMTDHVCDWYVTRIKEDLEKDPACASVAPVDFGRHQIEGMSYTVGATALRILWGLVGQDEFNHIIGGFYQEHASGATAREFVAFMKSRAGVDLTRYADDWWLGTGWAAKVREGKKPADMVLDYRADRR